MDNKAIDKKLKACVTGGNGYMASLLIKQLLQKGYAVNTTARDLDLTDEGRFEEAVMGCHSVFHTATPVDFASEDPEKDMIKPAIQGTLDILKACTKAQTVKRVVVTLSAAAASINKLNSTNLVMDEECWTDVEYLYSEKPPTWGYAASKTLAEKKAWKYAEENKIDLITVIPSLMAGPSITPNVPSSICLAMSLNSFGDFSANAKLILSSEKLTNEGFSFKYGIEEIYDQSVEYFKKVGPLQE
ncbi:hypothetical protein IFM89_016384 [Coptis chinensis]|uniref:NAD-dependent epimerase/dehydratase domain-containing protein n=1 Tax=Coptis chinensis TaxID=261450 RepID=A0A835HFN0_9MAGN|nr:hypothetical protein IFM89_016384 [Coptis chinensis]